MSNIIADEAKYEMQMEEEGPINVPGESKYDTQMEEEERDDSTISETDESNDSTTSEIRSDDSRISEVRSDDSVTTEADLPTMEGVDESADRDSTSRETQQDKTSTAEKEAEDVPSKKNEKKGVWGALRATFGKDGYVTRLGENIPGVADVITVVHALKGNTGQAARAAQKSLAPALLAVGHRLLVHGDVAGALDRTANALPSYQGVLVRAAVSMLHVGRGDVRSTLLNMLGNPVVWFNYEGAVKLNFVSPGQESAGLPLQIEGAPIDLEWEPCSNLPVGASTVHLVRYIVSWFLLGKKDLNLSDLERRAKKRAEKGVELILETLRSTRVGRVVLGERPRRRVRFHKKVFTEAIQGLRVVHMEQLEWVELLGSGETGMRRASVRLGAALIPILLVLSGARMATVIRFLAMADLTFLAVFIGALLLQCHFATAHADRVLGSTLTVGKRVFGNVMAFQYPSMRLLFLAYHYLGIAVDLLGRFCSARANTIVREHLPAGDAVVIRIGVQNLLLEAQDVLGSAMRGGSIWVAAAAMTAGIFPTTTVRVPLQLSGLVLPMFLKANGDKVQIKLDETVDVLMTMNPKTQELCIVVPDTSVKLALGGLQVALNQADLRRHNVMVQPDCAEAESDSDDDDKPCPFAKHHSLSPLCKDVVDAAEVLRWVWQGPGAAPEAVQPDDEVVPEGPQEPEPDEDEADEAEEEPEAEDAKPAEPEWLESSSPVADFFAPVQCGIGSLELYWETPCTARLVVCGTTSHLVLQDDIVTSWLVIDKDANPTMVNTAGMKETEKRAATMIQSVWRGVQCRAKAAKAKVAAEIEAEDAAVKLQAAWRGSRLRSQLAKAAIAAAATKRASDAAVALQAAWRGQLGRAEANQLASDKESMEAAVILQAAWRGKHARTRAEEARRAMDKSEALDDDSDLLSSWVFVDTEE